jgi:hypothetical protein
MRDKLLKTVKLTAALIALLLVSSTGLRGQECDKLRTATDPELVSYLKDSIPNRDNAECMTLVIQKLGDDRYEPAVATLARLLDFRRPPTERERQGLYLHAQGIWEIYPAANSLVHIGTKSLSAMSDVIRTDSSSVMARENAVFVWMEIHKYEHPKAVALLKQEMDKTPEVAARNRLQWALAKAFDWCNPDEKDSCRTAARTGLT